MPGCAGMIPGQVRICRSGQTYIERHCNQQILTVMSENDGSKGKTKNINSSSISSNELILTFLPTVCIFLSDKLYWKQVKQHVDCTSSQEPRCAITVSWLVVLLLPGTWCTLQTHRRYSVDICVVLSCPLLWTYYDTRSLPDQLNVSILVPH